MIPFGESASVLEEAAFLKVSFFSNEDPSIIEEDGIDCC
jgi:hypothetical protein